MQRSKSSISVDMQKIEGILFKSSSNRSVSILLSCLMTAPNQIFRKCCQQSPSKNFISSGDQPSFSARAVISVISNRRNFRAVAQVSVIITPCLASFDNVRSLPFGIMSTKSTQAGYISTVTSHHASNNSPLSLNVCIIDLLSDSAVSSSAIIDGDNVIVLNPPSDKNRMITFLIEV